MDLPVAYSTAMDCRLYAGIRDRISCRGPVGRIVRSLLWTSAVRVSHARSGTVSVGMGSQASCQRRARLDSGHDPGVFRISPAVPPPGGWVPWVWLIGHRDDFH